MYRLKTLTARIAGGMLSLLVTAVVLVSVTGIAINDRPFSVSAFVTMEKHAATPGPDRGARPIIVAMDTIPAILISGSILLMIVVAPHVSRERLH